ncbi:MAG: (Fe-S)-binding protein [Candidatus Bathyarchaeota archaeon]|nr:MAG: (Fe-S)-binding protein [Candidatus Bathyarchaeota archaeon]
MSAQEFAQKHKLLECIHCGICTGSCPVARKAALNIRKYMREVSVGGKLTIHPQDELWSCTTCATCGIRCPKEILPYDFLIDIRGLAVEQGRIATTLRDALESIFKNGNPWGRVRSKRSDWARDLNIKHVSQGVEFLYFVGCTPAYDPRIQDVTRSLVQLFEKTGVSFGTLGDEENCCGNEVYGMGEKGLFEFLVEENMKLFNKHEVKQVVTSCPHSYHSFKNKYGQTKFEIFHHTQLLADLIDEDRLRFSKRLDKTVVYHDPCFIGKQNNIYDEPRKVIEGIPGTKLVEFERSRERSLCCEGGGGRMWIDISGDRLAEARVKDAAEAGAEILVAACPFCVLTFEDAVKTAGLEGKLQILDVAELVSQAI